MSTRPAPADARPILVVDDDPRVHRFITRALKRQGHEIVSAQDPCRALPLLHEHGPKLLVLDMAMPGMDGLELLARVRKVSNVPVIMLTGLDRSALAVRALRQGAYDYLTKPVTLQRLNTTVSMALSSAKDDAGEADEGDENRCGSYILEREIGSGGMGTVYEATDTVLKRPVAIKVLRNHLAADPHHEMMFLREAQAAAKLAHTGIVTVYGAGRAGKRLYIAMELVSGTTVRAFQDAGYPFSVLETVDILRQAADALSCAHTAGVMHRDIKPANLMLTGDRTLKILDFGLARTLQAPSQVSTERGFTGTLAYAAPEQIQVRPVDALCDVYSLGVVGHELLTGDRAFPREGLEVVTDIIAGNFKHSLDQCTDVPRALTVLVQSMTAIKKGARPASMDVVRDALRDIARDL